MGDEINLVNQPLLRRDFAKLVAAGLSLTPATAATPPSRLAAEVTAIVDATPAVDVHTHLYAPSFGELSLWGVDELLRYHYLVAELFRYATIRPEQYWSMSRSAQADLIWDTLFVRNTPLSEATRGVVYVFNALGLDPAARNLKQARAFFAGRDFRRHLDTVLRLANISEAVMTNDPLDTAEVARWEQRGPDDRRFRAAIRLDGMVNAAPQKTAADVRKLLDSWIARTSPVYLAFSLPNTFQFPEDSPRGHMIREAVLPACRDHHLPLALMIGVKRGVNPALRDAGDGSGIADLSAVERLCREYGDVRFLVSLLARENQHELCVLARKFANLMPFGCWWFMNNPSIIEEIISERVEMLGTSFIPQHSDARVLEQVIYKWKHSRRVIAGVLTRNYEALARDGRLVSRSEIERDVKQLFSGNFRAFTAPPAG